VANFGLSRRRFAVMVGNENNPAPLNLRRGLFRVWVVMSAAWIMGWTIYLIIFGLRSGFQGFGEVLAVPVILFGPPVALLIFGVATRWALLGFKGEPKPPEPRTPAA
jgi:hypothetical protein